MKLYASKYTIMYGSWLGLAFLSLSDTKLFISTEYNSVVNNSARGIYSWYYYYYYYYHNMQYAYVHRPWDESSPTLDSLGPSVFGPL